MIGALTAYAALLVLWIVVIKPNWVKVTANAYAKRLLASRDQL